MVDKFDTPGSAGRLTRHDIGADIDPTLNHYGNADWDLDRLEEEVKRVSRGSLRNYRGLDRALGLERTEPSQDGEGADGQDSGDGGITLSF